MQIASLKYNLLIYLLHIGLFRLIRTPNRCRSSCCTSWDQSNLGHNCCKELHYVFFPPSLLLTNSKIRSNTKVKNITELNATFTLAKTIPTILNDTNRKVLIALHLALSFFLMFYYDAQLEHKYILLAIQRIKAINNTTNKYLYIQLTIA